MKRALIATVAAAVAFTGLLATEAMAQDWGPGHRPPEHSGYEHPDNGHRPPPPPPPPRVEHRREVHHWRTGERLPRAYRGRDYVIVQPHHYHLRPAPRGREWVRVGPDAMLVIPGTGLIVEFVPGVFR